MRTVTDLIEGVDGMLMELIDGMVSATGDEAMAELKKAADIAVPVANLQLNLASVRIQHETARLFNNALDVDEQTVAET